MRLPVVAYIGLQEWERFHIDLVGSDLRMIGEPDVAQTQVLAHLPPFDALMR